MKVKSALKASLLLCIFLCLASCQTTQVQVGIGGSRSHKAKKKLAAYKIDYKTGFRIARQICNTVFDQSAITGDGSGIKVYHEGSFWTEGTAGATIYPRLNNIS